jgi:glycosyltransferase involved in cell wall biosynthesis
MLTGGAESGVGGSIRELLWALAGSPGHELRVFSTPSACAGLPVNGNVHYEISRFAGASRTARVVWQHRVLPRRLKGAGLDVYHATGYVLSSKWPEVPAVLSVYDLTALEYPELTTRANAAHYARAVPRGARAARRVIVPSAWVARKVRERLGVPWEKIDVVPLGVAGDFCPNGANAAPGEGDRYVLFAGNLERKKNVGLLIRVLGELRRRGHRLRLVLAGKRGNAAGELAAVARRSGVQDFVEWPGYVPRSRLVDLYRQAVALLFPSWDEGFGLPPLESMSCGTPVVASNRGALPETTGGAAILVDPEDERGWVEAVEALAGSEPMRREWRERGLKRVAGLTWERAAGGVLESYRRAWREGTRI